MKSVKWQILPHKTVVVVLEIDYFFRDKYSIMCKALMNWSDTNIFKDADRDKHEHTSDAKCFLFEGAERLKHTELILGILQFIFSKPIKQIWADIKYFSKYFILENCIQSTIKQKSAFLFQFHILVTQRTSSVLLWDWVTSSSF